MAMDDEPYQLCADALVQHERPFSSIDRLRYRFGALVSRYYRERAAALSCTGLRAKALRRCVTSRDGQLLLVKNYKAACTTGTQLVHHYDHGLYWSDGDVHGTRRLAQGLLAARRHLAALDSPTTLRLTFVRDPLARLVSGFVMVFVGRSPYTKWAHAERGMWRLGYDPDGSVARNFDIFLEFLAQAFALDPAHANPHWRPQVMNIAYGEIDYGLIGRVERLRDDIQKLGDRLDHRFPDLEQATGPHFHRGRDAGALLTVTPAHRARARHLFAADYEAFSY